MTLSPWLALGVVAGWSVVLMSILWIAQRRTGDAGVVDVGWAASLGLAAVFYALASDADPWRRGIVGALGGLWAMRLATYLFLDRIGKGEEDGRYQKLREDWGDRAQRNLFLFFQAQAFFVVLFSAPLLAAAYAPGPLAPAWAAVAIALWVVSVGGEAIADTQLARFRRDPANRGKTCRSGLWRYSRHPNYFFEWIHWWSYVALSVGTGAFLYTLAGPVVMIVFLYKITGIPYTEERAIRSRGEDYRQYQRTTSAFVPWFPKADGKAAG